MRLCPNVDCGYAKKFGRPGEYQDSAVTCSDCGTALVDQLPPLARPATVAKPAEVKPSDANSRLAVTIGAGAALVVLSSLPLLGAPTSVFEDGSAMSSMKMLAVGMTPFVGAFTLVELIALMVPALRLKRVGGKHARASLDRVAWILGFVLLVVQLFAVERWARSFGAEFGHEVMPPAALVWLQYAFAHGAMLGLAYLVSRAGLGHGLALVMVMALVQGLGEAGGAILRAVESETVSLGAVALIAVLIGFVVKSGLRFARQSRPAAGPLPTAVPFPVSGAAAWVTAGAVLSLPATLAAWLPEAVSLQRALQSSATVYLFLSAFIAFDVALALGVLFFRPQVIGGIWKRWNPAVDETGAISAARALLPRALMLSIGFTVGVPLLFATVGNTLSVFIGASTVIAALIIACAIADMVDEWRALRRLGPLVSVWEVQRTAEVEPIASLLGAAGIELHPRSFLLRTTQQFFAPWIPVSILVPQARAEEAKALLAKR